jgi:glycosyltransferase involved in cell wall biosynthesis
MSSLLAQLPPPPPGRTGWPWTEETPPERYSGRTDWPRISIVTPSYNQAAYIEETIRSILLQNYPNLHHIVIDGGSTDDTVAILKKYASWISHWESEPDRGQSHAINKGLARCDGLWFNWINSDDCLLPGALASLASVPNGASIISGAQSTGPTLAASVPLGRTRIGATIEDTLVNHFICQQGLFFRTETVKAVHGVCEELHYIMDLDLFARVLLKNGLESVREIPEMVAFFRRHEQAKTTIAVEKFHREERRVFHSLGIALGLEPLLLAHVRDTTEPLARTNDLSRLDPVRLSRLLALKFWWNGDVEVAWHARNITAFKQAVCSFDQAFSELRNSRLDRLRFFARLPAPILRCMSLFRSHPKTFL